MIRRKRRIKPPRPIRLRSLESRYAANIMMLLRQYQQAVLNEVNPIITTLVIRQDDETDLLNAAFKRIQAFVEALTASRTLGRIAQQAAFDVNAANSTYHQTITGKLLGVQPVVAEPWLDARVRSFTAENVSLITTLPKESVANIEQMLYREQRRGLSPNQLRAKIVEEFDVTEGRARVIARDQVAKFNASLTQTRQTNLGITQYTWRTVEDGRVRSDHRHLDGKVFKWTEPPITVTVGKRAGERNHPGQDIQCFDDSVLVSNYSAINRLFRRWYTGEFTKIVTSSGKSLHCTSNHPILTQRGWIAAKCLDIGDQVFRIKKQRLNVLNTDAQQGISFKDYFSAFSLVLPIETARAFGSQFHGDTIVDQQVDIINTDLLLRDDIHACFFQNLSKFFFASTDDAALVFFCVLRSFYLTSNASLQAFGGNIGRLGEFFSFLFTQAGHSDVISLRNASAFNPRSLKSINDHSVSNIEPGCNLFEAHAVCVHADYFTVAYLLSIVCMALMPNQRVPISSDGLTKIIGMNTDSSGDLGKIHTSLIEPYCFVDNTVSYFKNCHVFTFETKNGWYDAEDIIVQNCRCYAEPIINAIK